LPAPAASTHGGQRRLQDGALRTGIILPASRREDCLRGSNGGGTFFRNLVYFCERNISQAGRARAPDGWPG
jgi:hypothetical protein